MRLNRWMLTGAAAVASGVVMLALSYATAGTASAQLPPCDATATPTEVLSFGNTGQDVRAAGEIAPCTATPTRSATATATLRIKTHTPTPTSTEAPKTATPVPPTQAPPTKTPSTGNEGVAVKPPNTGSGGGASRGALPIWLLALGAASVLLGGGFVATGLRRR